MAKYIINVYYLFTYPDYLLRTVLFKDVKQTQKLETKRKKIKRIKRDKVENR